MAEGCFHCEVGELLGERIKAGTLTYEDAATNLTQLVGEILKEHAPDDVRDAAVRKLMKFLVQCAAINPDKLTKKPDEPQPTRH